MKHNPIRPCSAIPSSTPTDRATSTRRTLRSASKIHRSSASIAPDDVETRTLREHRRRAPEVGEQRCHTADEGVDVGDVARPGQPVDLVHASAGLGDRALGTVRHRASTLRADRARREIVMAADPQGHSGPGCSQVYDGCRISCGSPLLHVVFPTGPTCSPSDRVGGECPAGGAGRESKTWVPYIQWRNRSIVH